MGGPGAQAQTTPEADPAAAEQPEPADPFGRSTPAGTVAGFVEALADRDYDRAGRYLDLSDVPKARRAVQGPERARQLQRALDQAGEFLPRIRLSDAREGHLTDHREPDLEVVGSLGVGEQAAPLLLQRVESDEGPVWLIAGANLAAAAAVAGADSPPVLAERWLPAPLSAAQIAGAPLSHWVTLLGLSVLTFAIAWLALRLVLTVLGRAPWRRGGLYRFFHASAPPLAVVAALIATRSVGSGLGISLVARQSYGWLAEVVGWAMLGWLLWRLVDVVNDRLLEGFGRRGQATATGIVRFAGRVAKVVVVAIAVLAILDAFGYDITAAVAALGIGGLALALGAQRTVESLIASVSIISDRPFRVGDFCRIGNVLGIVEDIGMRSTRVRTLNRTVATIPNNSIINAEVENFAARDRFWFKPTLHLAADTPPGKVRALLEALRATLDGDERLLDGTARVRLVVPSDDRLPIEIFGYVLAADYNQFLAVQEELTLRLLDAVAAQDLRLAPPALDLRGPAAGGGAPQS